LPPRALSRKEGVPVETYFPGAILPEMLKGAEVYQTGRADYSPSGKGCEEIIK
jgi:hypothetical protein